MNSAAAFPADPSRARRARHALDTYHSANGSAQSEPRELIATFLADLAHLAAEQGVNYGALIAHAQTSWLSASINALPRPPPKSESSFRQERSPA